jgi:hypothetical protein
MRFLSPPSMSTERGNERRVGLEIEFAGVSIEAATDIVVDLFGGRAAPKNRFEATVEGALFGDWRVEVDCKQVTDRTITAPFGKLFGERAQDTLDTAVESIVALWIPSEIVTPPIPVSRLPEMEKLRLALAKADARGTHASLLYGFAFQLNPEVPSTDVVSLRRHLQAFLVLYDWLLHVADVDLARRVGPFITAFPEEYRQAVLSDGYDPSLERFIADYLVANPTRCRPLDMLPVFASLRPRQVLEGVGPKMKVNARPTYHYRLPNSLIDEPDWSFALEWNRWCQVERLAADPHRLRELSRMLLRHPPSTTPQRRAWIEQVQRTFPRPSRVSAAPCSPSSV